MHKFFRNIPTLTFRIFLSSIPHVKVQRSSNLRLVATRRQPKKPQGNLEQTMWGEVLKNPDFLSIKNKSSKI